MNTKYHKFHLTTIKNMNKKIITVCFMATAILACNSEAKQNAEIQAAKQMVIDSIAKAESTKKAIIDSMQQVALETKKQEELMAARTPTSNTETTATTKKKGWSNTAKGAVIGAGVGVATGIIVNKNNVEGAVVGGVIGAAVGAGTGAIIDKNKKKR